MMCTEMDPFHVTDLPHRPTTLTPNGVLYEVYVTYAQCADSPSVAHIKMTLEGRWSVFGEILQVYIKLHTVCEHEVSQREGLDRKLFFNVQEYRENRSN